MGRRKIYFISVFAAVSVSLLLTWYFRGSRPSLDAERTENRERRMESAVHTSLPDARYQHSDSGPSVRIIAVGDILLGRGVGSRIRRANRDYRSAFEDVAPLLRQGHVVFGNLEAPITDRSRSLADHADGGKFIISSPSVSVEALRSAGFNLLNLAGNHMMDHYEEGLSDTIDILDRNGIAHAGAGDNLELARKAAIIEKNGLVIGMLGYTDWADLLFKGDPDITFAAEADKAGVAPRDADHIGEDVRNLRGRVDVLIVSLHWGVEGSSRTAPDQVAFAHGLIDMGADVILGHHPHRFQAIEIYKGKPIVYSLGNFIFDQNDTLSRQSFIVDIELRKNALIQLSAVPITILDKIRVVKTTGREASDQMDRLLSFSRALDSHSSVMGDRLVFDIARPVPDRNVPLAEAD